MNSEIFAWAFVWFLSLQKLIDTTLELIKAYLYQYFTKICWTNCMTKDERVSVLSNGIIFLV